MAVPSIGRSLGNLDRNKPGQTWILNFVRNVLLIAIFEIEFHIRTVVGILATHNRLRKLNSAG